MSGFSKARLVETEAEKRLMPWLKGHTEDGRLVLTNKGTLAPFLQRTVGDMAFNHHGDGRLYTAEMKAESEHTGNVFLETWSNKNLHCKESHAERGSRPGWMFTQRADLLFYYFLDVDSLYIFDFFRLKQWAFGAGDRPARLYAFREVGQRKYQQLNDTHGRIVPLSVLEREVGFRLVHPRNLHAFPAEAA